MVKNNIFAFGRTSQIERAGTGSSLEFTFERNLVYGKQGKMIGYWNTANRTCACDHNLYWSEGGEQLIFGDKRFAEWQAAGQDHQSLVADPMFADPEHGDFRLRPGSPAAQIGFEPWALSAVGPRPLSAASRRRLYLRHYPAAPPVP
jgi:hypothetical protein